MSEEIEISRITIIRRMTLEGEDMIQVLCSDGLTLLDSLGMLSFATASLIADAEMNSEDDES